MNESIYDAPKADVTTPESNNEIPKKILERLRQGFIASVFLAIINFIFTTYSAMHGAVGKITDLYIFGDTLFVLILAYWIYKKSRIASTIIVIYYAFSIFLRIMSTSSASSIISCLILIYLIKGMIGSYQYHNFIKSV